MVYVIKKKTLKTTGPELYGVNTNRYLVFVRKPTLFGKTMREYGDHFGICIIL